MENVKTTAENRLYYLDNIKVLLIFLVIIHHVGQAYGATGGAWFYSYPGDRVESLRLLFRFNASFFMGLFSLYRDIFFLYHSIATGPVNLSPTN